MNIAPMTARDADAWLQMREALWPGDLDGHREAIARFLAGDRREPREALLAIEASAGAVGFVELSIRNIVDGCASDRVGYLEGWYVAPAHRRRGVGRALVAAAERWAVGQGCTEFASDSLIENAASLAAHRALGFEETGRVCNFRKDLPAAPG